MHLDLDQLCTVPKGVLNTQSLSGPLNHNGGRLSDNLARTRLIGSKQIHQRTPKTTGVNQHGSPKSPQFSFAHMRAFVWSLVPVTPCFCGSTPADGWEPSSRHTPETIPNGFPTRVLDALQLGLPDAESLSRQILEQGSLHSPSMIEPWHRFDSGLWQLRIIQPFIQWYPGVCNLAICGLLLYPFLPQSFMPVTTPELLGDPIL